MDKKSNSKISIMIIPHTERVKRISFSTWVPKAIIIALATLSIAIIMMIKHISSSNLNLKREYKDKISEITNLETENKDKEKELSELKSQNEILYEKTNEIEDKLEEIEILQKRLEKLANIKSPSRKRNIGRDLRSETLEPEEGMEALNKVLEDKKQELEIFVQDVEEKFEYLECTPDLWPTQGKLTSGFGNRKNPLGRGNKFHQGIDIANPSGTNILAAGKGTVSFSGNRGGYGKVIMIEHGNEYHSLYAHNEKLLVNVGDKVEKGQIIGKMGSTGRSTGPHLHFEIHKNGSPINPLEVLK